MGCRARIPWRAGTLLWGSPHGCGASGGQLCYKGWDPAMGQAPRLWEEVEAGAGTPPLERRDPAMGQAPWPQGGQGGCVHPWGRGACYGAAPPSVGAGDWDPPWGWPHLQDGGTAAGGGCRRGVPRPAGRAPRPPRLLRIPQRLSRAGPPPAQGGPAGGAGRGPGPPGRGGVGMGGGLCHVCWVRRAPHPPDTALGVPPPCPGRCGWPGGHSRGTGSALARVRLGRSLLR